MAARPPEVPSTSALIVAAGSSTRMGAGAGIRKPFLALGGLTVIEHACSAFDRVAAVTEIVVVGHADDLDRLRALAASSSAMRKVRALVPGGELRTDSVRAGVRACAPGSELVAVHDAARPLVTSTIIERALHLAAREGAALVAVPVVDTVKTSADGERADATLDRSVLWAAQTPQVFRRALLVELLERAAREGFRPTDEAALHERYVGPIPISRGASHNAKLTTPEDLAVFTALLRLRQESDA
ncbi:MAG: 2-C-methyl-D-erythritol 4-phosphate cytidylyltransferase [Planctomycetota bacterium]|nr:2-C-methyl-D-erythritol 4-phosphate cytidylyltransferase [Planctomycetota bacterium]